MPAVKQDLVIEQGTTWSKGFEVNVDGVPIDDTWSARAQVRSSAGTSTILHEWSTDLSNIDIADGVVKLSVSASESAAWYFTEAVYDLEISKDDQTYRVVYGTVTNSMEVTR